MWELDYNESWVPKNWCFWTVVLKKTLVSPLECKEIQPVHSKGDQSWVLIGRTDVEAEWNSNTLATWCEELTRLERPWCWERLRAGWVGDDRGWDGWMASPTQWTWVWVNSGSWWWTGRPGGLQSMGLESRIWLSDWTELNILIACYVTSEIWETSCLLIAIWQKKLSKKEVWYKKNRHNNTQGQDSNGIGTIS